MRIRYIDAKRLRMLLIAGSKWLVMHEEVLNELNVYPVPDGDTGSNMSMTISSVEKELTKVDEKSSMNEVSEAVEEAILMGARGNSGTILSQIITGFLKGIGDKDRLYAADVVTALESAKEVAYKAVNQPVEGTILTVIRKVAESAREYVKTSDDLVGLLENIKDTAQEAVEQTPEELPKLKEAGVVDAGAKGLFYMLEGFYMLITQADLIEEIEPTEVKNADFSSTIANIDHDPDSIKFQYCTEFIIGSSSFDTDKFKAEILELGDSAVFAQSSKKFKVHVHTNNPGQALELALKNGDLEKVKIENMKLQHENLYVKQPDEEGAKIFVSDKVTLSEKGHIIVADTENLKNEFLKNGADVVILALVAQLADRRDDGGGAGAPGLLERAVLGGLSELVDGELALLDLVAPVSEQFDAGLSRDAGQDTAGELRRDDSTVDLEHDVHRADFLDVAAGDAVEPENLREALFLGAFAGADGAGVVAAALRVAGAAADRADVRILDHDVHGVEALFIVAADRAEDD